MKKYYWYIIMAGIVSGLALKDPFSGPLFGTLIAVLIGIPFFLFLSRLVKLFIKGNAATIDLTALLSSVFVVIGIFWFLFQPPGWFVFRLKLGNPPLPSVKGVHARWRYGFCDVPIYIKFEINKADLNKVIINKTFERYEFDQYEEDSFRKDEWLNLRNMDKIEVYRKVDTDSSEYIIHDSNNGRTYYILFSIG